MKRNKKKKEETLALPQSTVKYKMWLPKYIISCQPSTHNFGGNIFN